MKTVLTKFLAISGVALLMLASCKKDEVKVVATNGTPGALQASATTIVLTKADVANTAVTFTLTNANFGFKAAETNVLQLDVQGDNFAKPKEFTIGSSSKTQAFSVVDFNNLLLALGLPTGTASQVEARIKSSISATTAPVYSNTVALSVTPFALISYTYVVGAFQGWNIGAQDSLQSPTANGVYTGVINFGTGSKEFLITPVKGSYDNKFATNDPLSAPTNTITVGGPNNLVAATKTTVDPAVNITTDMITLNTNDNTIKLTPTQWSVVGDATPGSWPNGSGYQSDTDMKFNNGTQTWSVVVALTGGKAIKFRLNHDWGTNYGSKTTAGVLDTANDNNITVAADGTYLVTIDINHLTYSLVKQ